MWFVVFSMVFLEFLSKSFEIQSFRRSKNRSKLTVVQSHYWFNLAYCSAIVFNLATQVDNHWFQNCHLGQWLCSYSAQSLSWTQSLTEASPKQLRTSCESRWSKRYWFRDLALFELLRKLSPGDLIYSGKSRMEGGHEGTRVGCRNNGPSS